MSTKGTTWPPTTQTGTRPFFGTTTQTTDTLTGRRSTAEHATVKSGESRPIESHWEALADRATD